MPSDAMSRDSTTVASRWPKVLAGACEHRQARVLGRDVVDQLQHVHGLADAGAAEQTDFPALGERADEVDDLDAGFEQFHGRRQLVELRRRLVDRAQLVRLDRAAVVDRPTEHVHDAAERALTYRNGYRRTGADHFHAAAQAVGGTQRDAAHNAVAELLLDFEGQAFLRESTLGRIHELERVVDLRHPFTGKLNVGYRADALNDGSLYLCHGYFLNVISLYGCSAGHDFGKLFGDAGLTVLVVDQRQLVDQVARVVRGGLHRHHARGLLGGHVLGHGLEDDRLDVARHHLVEYRLGFRLIEVIPHRFRRAHPFAGERQQLFDHRLLLHGVDEARIADHQSIEPVLGVAIEHHLDGADQLVHLRAVADLDRVRHDVRTQALHEAEALIADCADVDLLALRLPRLVLVERHAGGVGVEGAAQPFVRSDHDQSDALDAVARHQKRVAILRIGVADMRRDVADFLAVGARHAHALLRLAHLRGGDHLHRLGDFPGVLHTPDLHPYLFGPWHLFCPSVPRRREPRFVSRCRFSSSRRSRPSAPSRHRRRGPSSPRRA